MLDRKGSLGLAVCTALALAGSVKAEGTQGAPDAVSDGYSLVRPLNMQTTAPAEAAAPTQPAPSKPLMALLEKIGVGKTLEDAHINIYGFIEGGYTYSASAPPGNVITGYVFNTKHERIVLDQLDLTVERTVDDAIKDKKFDIGGRFEALVGWDAGLIHSSGIYDNPATLGVTSGYYKSRTSPENQFDINQAYLDFALPVGNGLRIRAGKFVTLLGQEVINPTGNALYSHSYLFGFAIPFTQTGVYGTYILNDSFTFDAGITRGWNQSLRDNNGSPDLLARVTYTPNKDTPFLNKTQFLVSLSEGPQATHDNGDWWTVIDAIMTYKPADNLSFALNADYGDAPHVLGGGPGSSAQWYGMAGYGSLVLTPMFTLNARAEWYSDQKGFTLGTGVVTNVYEATVGVAITPMPNNDIGKNLVIRPEIRYDYADKRFFDAGTDHYQFTAAIDAYFTF